MSRPIVLPYLIFVPPLLVTITSLHVTSNADVTSAVPIALPGTIHKIISGVGGYEGVFTDTEEHILQDMQADHDIAHGFRMPKVRPGRALKVVFLKANQLGSAVVRADEASLILRMHGWDAISVPCRHFCRQKLSASVVIHVKTQCICAHRQKIIMRIYDPIDSALKYSKIVLADFTHIFAGTMLMRDKLNQLRSKYAIMLPHHHSNFQNRTTFDTKVGPSRSSHINVVIGGDAHDNRLRNKLSKCLINKLNQSGLTYINVAVKFVHEVSCDTRHIIGPSMRGDCFAQKLSFFDIGIAWFQNFGQPLMLEIKPPQRVANMLAVGLPVVADSRLAAHRDVHAYGPTAVTLVGDEESLCNAVLELALDESLRYKASIEALYVAEHQYSPRAIAKQYDDALGGL